MRDDGIEQWEERLRSGDEAALAMLWSLHRDRLLRLVRYRLDPRLPRRVDADDLLQESYLAARQRLARFGADGFRSSFVWLRLIVVQSLIDHHRHHVGAEMRAADREQADAGTDADSSAAALVARLSAAGPSPSHRLRAEERREQMRRAILRLASADREILALRHGEQLSNQETAEALGIAIKAASIRHVRALRRLKDALEVGGGATSYFALQR